MDIKRDKPGQASLWVQASNPASPHGVIRHTGEAASFALSDGVENQPGATVFAEADPNWTESISGTAPFGAVPPAFPVPAPLPATSPTGAPALTPPQSHVAHGPSAPHHAAAGPPAGAGSAPASQAAPQIASIRTNGTQSTGAQTGALHGQADQITPAAQTTVAVAGTVPLTTTDAATGGNGGQTEQIDFTSPPVPAILNTQSATYMLPSSLYETKTLSTTASFGGVHISAGVSVFAGIKGSVSLGLGDVTPDYPVSIDPNALDSVIDNTVFTIDPSLISTNDASFSLDLPSAQANLDIGLQANAHLNIAFPTVAIGVSIPFYGYVGTNITLPSLPISLNVSAAFNPAQNTVFDFGEGASLTVSQVNQSSVNSGTESATGSLPTLYASGSTPSFLTGAIDLVQLLGDVLPESGLAAVDGSREFNVGAASWSLFSLPLSVSLGLGETVTATPMGITETATDELNGEVQSGPLGSKLSFDAPTSGSGVIPISISYTLTLQIATTLGLDGTISLNLDGPAVSATLLGVGGFSEGPFGQKTLFTESGQIEQLAQSTSDDLLTGSSVVDVDYQATAVSETITTPSGGVLLNSQDEQLTNKAGVTIAGATYGIEALVQCVPDITNSGTVSSEAYHSSNPGTPAPVSYGIDLLGGGVVTNTIGGLITSSNYGTRSGHGSDNPDAAIRLAANQTNDVYNAGLITGFETGVAINGGVLTNAANGTITTHSAYESYGIKVGTEGAQITNNGLINSTYGIKLLGSGEVNNTATGVIDGLYQAGIEASGSLTLTNSGNIISRFAGVEANGGVVINLAGGLIEGGFENGVFLGGTNAAVVNGGTISGNGAVYLDASTSNTLVIAQGAVFDGTVQAANAAAANGIYLAAGSTGTLAGVGTEFEGFQSITIGQDATWQIAGSAASLGTTTIDGFRPGDTLDFTGLAFTGRGPGYVTGESVQVDASTGVVSIIEAQSLNSAGITLATAQFGSVLANEAFNVVSDGNGGTLLEQTGPMNATISTAGLGGIVLAPGSVYAATLTITSSGSTADQGLEAGQTVNINYGIQSQGETVSITNAGSIAGYKDGFYLTQAGTISNLAGGTIEGVNGSGIEITGGIGIVLTSGLIEGTIGATLSGGGTLTNYSGGTITGGLLGVELGPQANHLTDLVNEGLVQCKSAAAVELTGGGFVYNEHGGTIAGGAITGRDFGVLAVNAFAKVTNCGSISGGTGIDLTAGGFVVNENGTIAGGVAITGGIGYLSSCGSISGVVGIAFSNGGTVVNSAAGTIISTEGYGIDLGPASAAGNDDVKNSGRVEGDTYGAILSSASNTLFNAGTIGSINGGDAVQLEGATNKLQLAGGFDFVGNVVAKSGAANSIELTASAKPGLLTGLGSTFLGFSAITLDSGAVWTIETSAVEAASLAFTGQSSKDTLSLTAAGTLGANLSGFGTLLLDAPGTFTIGSNTTLGDQVIAVGAGTVLAIAAAADSTVTLGTSGAGSFTNAGSLVIDGAGTARINTALVNDGIVSVTAGSLQVAGAFSGDGTLAIGAGTSAYINAGGALTETITGAGTLILGGAYMLANADIIVGTVQVNGPHELSGTGTIAGKLSVSGTVEASGGTLKVDGAASGNGTFSAAVGALLDLIGGGTISGAISGTVELAGATTLDAGTKLSAADIIETANVTLASASVTNTAGSLFAINAAASTSITLGSSDTSNFTNAGSLVIDGAGSARITTALVNDGIVSVTSGSLQVAGAFSGGGTLAIGAGTSAYITAGGALTETITGAGTLILGGAYTLGNTDITAGTVQVNGPHELSGTGTIAGKLIVSGTAEAYGGTLKADGAASGNGTLSAAAGALLDLIGGGTISGAVSGAGTIEFAGVTTLDAGTKLSAAEIIETANVTLASVGVTNAAADIFAIDAAASTSATLASSGTSSFTNAGSLLIDGAGTARITTALVNDGLVSVTSGSLQVAGAFSGDGTLAIGAGTAAYLTAGGALAETITGTGTLILGGAYTLANADITAGTVQVNGPHELSGNGTLAGAVIDSGTVASSGGTLQIGGAVSGSGTLSSGSGAVLDLAGGGTFAGTISGAGTVILGSAATLDAGARLSAAEIVQTAKLTLASVSVTNAAGNVFALAAAAGSTVTLGSSGTGAFTNAGSLLANGAGTAAISAPFTNAGTVSALTGTLSFLGSISGTGALDLGTAGTLSLGLGAGSGQSVDFLGATGVLDLANPLDFAGTITGFEGSDQIFLENTSFTAFGYSNNTLSVQDSGATVASLHFAGSNNAFALTGESHGVLITFV